MMADGFRVAAVILFAFAVVSILLAVLLYFTLHIRDVRRDLTGQTAQKYIAELSRSHGRWASEYAHSDVRKPTEDDATVEQNSSWSSADFKDETLEKIGTSLGTNESETEDRLETTLMGSKDNDTVAASQVPSKEEVDSTTTLLESSHDWQEDVSSRTNDDVDAFDTEEDFGTTLLPDANQEVEPFDYRHADNGTTSLFGSGKDE